MRDSRNEQFDFINTEVLQFQTRQQPVIAVEVWWEREVKSPASDPLERAEEHSHENHVILDSSTDIASDRYWARTSVGSYDASFMCVSIAQWWQKIGIARFAKPSELLIITNLRTHRESPSDSSKGVLQDLADELGINLVVSHLPAGTSKWTKVGHRFISVVENHSLGGTQQRFRVQISLISQTPCDEQQATKLVMTNPTYGNFRNRWEYRFDVRYPSSQAFLVEWNYPINPRRKY